MKDVFYVIEASLKRAAREEETVADGAAIRAIAWECLRVMQRRVLVTNSDSSVCLEAMCLRDLHDDFEGDLLIATAQQNEVALLVTSDKELLVHALVPCLTPGDACALLKGSA